MESDLASRGLLVAFLAHSVCFLRAAFILLLAAPLFIGMFVWKVIEYIVGYGSWPLVEALRYLYVQPVQYLMIRYVYPTAVGRFHPMCWRRKGGVQEQHSHIIRVKISSGCSVYPIPCLANNYAYLIVAERRGTALPAVLVDPPDADAVLSALGQIKRDYYMGSRIDVRAILTTHKHWDHCGGNAELKRRFPDLRVYGGASEPVPGCTHVVVEGQCLEAADGLFFEVLETPCHTRGHICYLLLPSQESWQGKAPACLFSGDTLFLGGNGMHFEGTQEEMLQGLAKIARTCSPDTLIFPGHEYTEHNLAQTMRHGAPFESPASFLAVAGLWWKAVHRRWWHRGLPTVPGRLEDELWTHPKFRKLRRLAELVETATTRPEENITAHTQGWSYSADFEVTPADCGMPFVTLWRGDWERHLSHLRACSPHWECLLQLEAAESQFRSWREPWLRGHKGVEPLVPSWEELTEALGVLGCSPGAGPSGAAAPLDTGVLRASLSAMLGRELQPKQQELLEQRCKATAPPAPQPGTERSRRFARLGCLGLFGRQGLRRRLEGAAAELLRDRHQASDPWQGLAPACCLACRTNRDPRGESPAWPASPVGSRCISPIATQRSRNQASRPLPLLLPPRSAGEGGEDGGEDGGDSPFHLEVTASQQCLSDVTADFNSEDVSPRRQHRDRHSKSKPTLGEQALAAGFRLAVGLHSPGAPDSCSCPTPFITSSRMRKAATYNGTYRL